MARCVARAGATSWRDHHSAVVRPTTMRPSAAKADDQPAARATAGGTGRAHRRRGQCLLGRGLGWRRVATAELQMEGWRRVMAAASAPSRRARRLDLRRVDGSGPAPASEAARRRRRNDVDGTDPPIAPPRHRLDEPRVLRGVAERLAEPVHRAVEAVIEVDEGVRRPEAGAQVVAADELALPLEQQPQDLDRTAAQPDPQASASQLARADVQLERPEPIAVVT